MIWARPDSLARVSTLKISIPVFSGSTLCRTGVVLTIFYRVAAGVPLLLCLLNDLKVRIRAAYAKVGKATLAHLEETG